MCNLTATDSVAQLLAATAFPKMNVRAGAFFVKGAVGTVGELNTSGSHEV
jgi:hypothetical protein